MIKLVFINGPKEGEEIVLDKEKNFFGSSTYKVINNIEQIIHETINYDKSISGLHCVFKLMDNNECTLKDEGSANGTYVNGLLIENEVNLNNGDFIRIGKTILQLKLE